jgi:hypothetical protein
MCMYYKYRKQLFFKVNQSFLKYAFIVNISLLEYNTWHNCSNTLGYKIHLKLNPLFPTSYLTNAIL